MLTWLPAFGALRSLTISAAPQNHRLVQFGCLLATPDLPLVREEHRASKNLHTREIKERKCELRHTPWLVGKPCSRRPPQNLRFKSQGRQAWLRIRSSIVRLVSSHR